MGVNWTPIVVLQVCAGTNVTELETIWELLRGKGYDIGQDIKNPLLYTIFKPEAP